MAIDSLTTSARTLKTARASRSRLFCSAVHVAFCDLLKNLVELTRIEELFASNWSFDPAFDFDPVDARHAHTVVQASVGELQGLTPISQGDKALKLAALLMHMVTDMNMVMDREALHHRVAHARVALLLGAEHPDAAVVNGLLELAFAQLDRLVALEDGDRPLEPCDGPDACDDARDLVICA